MTELSIHREIKSILLQHFGPKSVRLISDKDELENNEFCYSIIQKKLPEYVFAGSPVRLMAVVSKKGNTIRMNLPIKGCDPRNMWINGRPVYMPKSIVELKNQIKRKAKVDQAELYDFHTHNEYDYIYLVFRGTPEELLKSFKITMDIVVKWRQKHKK